MAEPEELVPRILDSLSESTPVDWERMLTRAARGEETQVVRALQDIADIAAAHDELRQEEEASVEVEHWGALEIEGRLGRGAHAEVFRAWDPTLNRKVALKLFHPERVRELTRERLLNEGRGLARLRHENVVTVYGADEQNGRVGISMEYVEGATLREVVEEHGRMSADEAASIGRRLCNALAAVHAKGMVHGDVKAQNIMRQEGEESGRIVLMDFSSIHTTDRSLPGQTDGGVVGTPLYMAPEMFRDARPDVTGDIYSLGVLLFYLVTGAFPVNASTISELRAAHRNRSRVLLRDLRPDLPDDFVHLVERSLSYDPDERFQSAGEMLQAIDASVAQNQLEVSGPVAGERASGMRPLVYLASLLLGLTGLGFIASMAWEVFLQIPLEFTDEGLFDYLLWGVRFMVPIAFLWFVLGGGLFLLGFLARRAASKVGQSRTFLAVPRRIRAWFDRSDPVTAALWILAISAGAFAAITWWFWGVLGALNELRYASPGVSVDVGLLGPQGRPFQQSRDIAYSLLSLGVLFALFRWFPPLERRAGEYLSLRLVRWGLVAIVAVSLVLCAIPYRLVWHNRSERVVFDGLRAYELGSNDDEVALYVPEGERRHRVVAADDPRLERPAERFIENIFQTD